MSKRGKSVLDACTSWIKSCERNGLERSTLRAYRSHVSTHIEPKIGRLLLSELTRAEVRDFMDELQDDAVSHAQLKKVMVSLRSILSEAVEREWLDQNVAKEVKVRRRTRAQADEKVIPTKDQIKLILENAPQSHRAMFVTALFTGMRISELRGLAWSGVDFDRSLIRVVQRADEFNELGPPKSRAGVRDIPMTPMVKNTLSAWRSEVRPSKMDLVFPNGVGRVQNYSNIYNRVFIPMMKELGITDEDGAPLFAIHSLRHAAASLFIEQGWNPKKIQTILGHASITMTMDVYGHLFENAASDVAMFEKLEEDLLAA